MIQHLWRQRRAFGNWARHGDVARSPRARVSQRGAVFRATRMGAKAVLGMAAFAAFVLPMLHPSGTPVFLLVSGVLAVAGLLALAEVRHFRRRPELIAFLLALLAGLCARVIARAVPEAATLMTSFLLLLPGALAILVPWRTSTHLRWIGIYGVTSILFLVGPLARGIVMIDQRDQVVAVMLAIAFSLLGHLLAQRSRLRYGTQLERGRVLRHETIRQRAEISHLYAELLHAARFDPLTQVGNRLLLQEDLRAMASRLSRSGGAAWVLAVDVDDFKQVNDDLGHDAGDRVLTVVAQTMRAQLRGSDSIYRYGGDEFVVLLADASEVNVRVLAERLRRAVEMCRFEGSPERITISLGGAPTTIEELESTDSRWLRLADEALYRVKASGRNGMLIVSGPSGPQRGRYGPGTSSPARQAETTPVEGLARAG